MSEPEGVVGHSVCSGHSWSGKSGRSLITRIALSRSPVTPTNSKPLLLSALLSSHHFTCSIPFFVPPSTRERGDQRFGPRSIFWFLSFALHSLLPCCWLLVAIPGLQLYFSSVLDLFSFYDPIVIHHLTEKGRLHQVVREYEHIV